MKRKEAIAQMEKLYASSYQKLFLYALTFLDSEDEAKDAVSDVFSNIWNQWDRQGEASSATPAYLYRLTRNRCLDILRHDKARRNYADFITDTHQPDSDDDVLLYEAKISELRNLIDQLPEPGKSILHCCYFRRFTYQQTADHLRLSIVVVKKNMLKVFKILRNQLNNSQKEGIK